ncbi:MAG TPA: rhodanese-like domain-containing protein [Gammaproteobacteria bacterium]|jgi:rhodanese-related sulfurtransferase
MPRVQELSPTEFRRRWPEDSAGVVLLDVREPQELVLASVSRAIHIPMREVPQRLHELDPATPLVVMCHGGGRSRRVAEFLATNGFEEIYNLAGGIDAWADQLDPSIPRY